MRVRDIVAEDFVNYKKPSMFISMGTCNWKCCIEAGIDKSVCQNSDLAKTEEINLSDSYIIHMYEINPISEAVVIGGLEPFTYFYNIYKFIYRFRKQFNDDIVIYTGYYPEELLPELNQLLVFDNIIIKFGRFIPNQNKHKDEILGVDLASNNQYAVKLTEEFVRNIE